MRSACRFATRKRPKAAPVWYQIVGAVREFPALPMNIQREREPTIYHPAGVGDIASRAACPLVGGRRAADLHLPLSRHCRGGRSDAALKDVGVLADLYHTLRAPFRSLAWATSSSRRASCCCRPQALRVDVLHGRAAHNARRIRTALGAPPQHAPLTCSDAPRGRSPPASPWARCSRPAASRRFAWARRAPCHSCWPCPKSWRRSGCWRR